MRKPISSGLFLFLIIILNACTKPVQLINITKNENGIFRGIDIGDSPEKVMSLEDSLTLKDKARANTYLYYDIPVKVRGGTKGANSFTIAYNFEDEHLYEIQVDVYLESEDDCQRIYKDFITLYNKKYGKYIKDQDYLVWNTKSAEGDNISIELINESNEYKDGKLSLTIFNTDY